MVISDSDIEIILPALDAYIEELYGFEIDDMPMPPWVEEALVKVEKLKTRLLIREEYDYN